MTVAYNLYEKLNVLLLYRFYTSSNWCAADQFSVA